jgi:hypothetical protein
MHGDYILRLASGTMNFIRSEKAPETGFLLDSRCKARRAVSGSASVPPPSATQEVLMPNDAQAKLGSGFNGLHVVALGPPIHEGKTRLSCSPLRAVPR